MQSPQLPDSVALVQERLAGLGIPALPRRIEEVRESLDGALRSGPASAACASSHLYRADARYLLVIIRNDRRVDPVALGAVLCEMRVAPVAPSTAADWTGQHPEAIAPVATQHPCEVIVDVDLAAYRTIWVPAGDPEWLFPTNYAQLLSFTAGMAAQVGELPAAGNTTGQR